MTYGLSSTSRQTLTGVHPDLVKLVNRSIAITEVDFRVYEGVRTKERQAKLVAKGASKTMASRHIIGADGFGHAVDLVPLIDFDGDGKAELRWDWPLCYKVAEAMRQASRELNITLRWGGIWDTPLANTEGDLEDAVAEYVERRRKAGLKAFLDGPHFELPFSVYN